MAAEAEEVTHPFFRFMKTKLLILTALVAITSTAFGQFCPFEIDTPPAPAAGITLVSSAQDLGDAGGCSVTLNTSGATLMFAIKTFYSTETALNDAQGNTWTLCTNFVSSSYSYAIYACTNVTGTSGTHTLSVPAGGGEGTEYRTLTVYAFSGINTAVVPGGSQIAHNSVGGGGATTVQPGSISGKVFVSVVSYNVAGTQSINESFNTPLQGAPGAGAPLVATSYFISSSSTAKNPTWTKTGSNANLSSGIVACE